MNRLTRRSALPVMLVTLFLLVLLTACGPEPTPTPTPTVVGQTTDTPVVESTAIREEQPEAEEPSEGTAAPSSETIQHTPCVEDFGSAGIVGPETIQGASDFAGSVTGYFVNQLLITGVGNDIDAILAQHPSVSPISTMGFIDPELNVTVTIGLYKYEPENGQDVIAEAAAINADADAAQVFVRAEPNYVLSSPQRRFDIAGAPGSPGIEGAPGSPGIEGAAGASPALTALNLMQFRDQWAFADVGAFDLSYLDSSNRQTLLTPPGIDLAVFDSSPLPSGAYYDDGLCVYALISENVPAEGLPPLQFADNHGLFVASLAGPMAHEGNIHLVQVLKADQDGALQGDLFTLLGSMHAYDEQIGAARQAMMVDLFGNPDIAHTIINLSLGFTFNPAAESNAPVINSVRSDNNTALPEYLTTDFNEGEGGQFAIELPVVSLRVMQERLDAAGYVVVAAAGNDGLELPQTPAAFPEVIGVEALAVEGERACFSNRGNISAPGGGPPSIAPPGDNDPFTPLTQIDLDEMCWPPGQAVAGQHPIDLTGCLTNPSCQEAITGHVWSLTTAAGGNGLGYWVGTSFATPLVSGLAQSVAEFGLSNGYNLTTAEVRQAVYCTASGTLNIVNPLAWEDTAGRIDSADMESCVEDVVAARP